MPTTLTIFAETVAKVRYREPYLTEGLNAKDIHSARGTYRGFLLTEDAINKNSVTVSPDPDYLDSVALFHTSTGYALTIRDLGSFDADLSGLVDPFFEKTWVLCLYATYAVGSPTTVTLRAYELSPTDEFTIAAEYPELVVLGTVTIPANNNAPIPAANIGADFRTYAWANPMPDATPWLPVLKNADFQLGSSADPFETGKTIPFWHFDADGGNAQWRAGFNHTGADGAVFNPVVTATTIDTYLRQRIGKSVTTGRRVRVRWTEDVQSVPSIVGTCSLNLVFRADDGLSTSTTSFPINLALLSGGAVVHDKTFPAPEDVLDRVEIVFTGNQWASTANALRIGYLQIWVANKAVVGDEKYGEPVDASIVTLRSRDATLVGNNRGATMEYDHVLDAIIFGKVDDTEPPPDLRSSSGTLTVKSTLDAQDIDAVSLDLATTLDVIGNSTVTTLTASGSITANAGVTAGAGQHITVSSTGRFKHGLRTLMMTAVEGLEVGLIGASGVSVGVDGRVAAGAGFINPWMMPITLDVGKRVLELRVIVEDSPGNTVEAKFWRTAHNIGGSDMSSPVQVGSTAGPTDQSGNIQVLTISTLTEVIATGYNYTVEIVSAGGGGVAACAMEIDYDLP